MTTPAVLSITKMQMLQFSALIVYSMLRSSTASTPVQRTSVAAVLRTGTADMPKQRGRTYEFN